MHGGNLIYKNLLLLAIILFSFSALANSESKIRIVGKPHDMVHVNTFLNNKKFYVSKRDLRAANNIETVFKLTKNNFVNSHILNRTYRAIRKSPAFSSYRNWITHLKRVNNTNNIKTLIKVCSNKLPTGTRIENELQRNLSHFCDNRFLSLSGHNIIERNKFLNNQLKFLVKNFDDFLFGRSQHEFSQFLNKISAKKRIHSYISSKVTEYLLTKNKVPSKELISSMKITPTLTRLVQMKGLDKNSTENIFYNELRLMAKNIYKKFEDRNNDINLVKKLREILNYTELNYSYLPKSRSINKLISLGKFLTRREYYDESRFLLQFAKRTYKKYEKEAQFRILWTYLVAEDYSNAMRFLNNDQIIKNHEKYDEKMIFWTSYVLNKNSKQTELNELVTTLINKNPLSYYAIMASKLLPKFGYYENVANNEFNKVLKPTLLKPYVVKTLKRIKVWSKLNQSRMIKYEVDSLTDLEKDALVKSDVSLHKEMIQSQLLITASNILNRNKDYLDSFKTIYTALNSKEVDLSKPLLKLLFPKPFLSKLKNYSNDTDPFILLSLIRQESGFNPRATSRVGARGLMQLMPSTAKQVARIRRTRSLNNPNVNLRVGTKYFNYLLNKYDNNLVYTLSAYNAGEARVNRWQNKFFRNNSILHTIESIPFQETKKYVQLIFRNIFFYKLLNEKDTKRTKFPNKIFDVSLGFKR